MSRINLEQLSSQAGGLTERVNQVRTDPAVVEAAQDAWRDLRSVRESCTVLAREASAAWQRSGGTGAGTGGAAYDAPLTTPAPAVTTQGTRLAS